LRYAELAGMSKEMLAVHREEFEKFKMSRGRSPRERRGRSRG
jgi:hypothetical protein